MLEFMRLHAEHLFSLQPSALSMWRMSGLVQIAYVLV
jgi:hypothetical protein